MVQNINVNTLPKEFKVLFPQNHVHMDFHAGGQKKKTIKGKKEHNNNNNNGNLQWHLHIVAIHPLKSGSN